MKTLWQDVRYGVRVLLKAPGFTVVAVLALALGIGASTAIFSVLNVVLLRALPFRHAERTVIVWEHNRTRNRPQNVISPANFLDWQDQQSVFEEMSVFYDTRLNLTDAGEAEEIPAQVTTANLFHLLGVEPVLGRTFTPDDAEEGRDNVVVLSYGLWQSRFGGEPDIVGKTLTLNGAKVSVLGVLPADFKWFIKEGSLTGKPAQMWTPFKLTVEWRERKGRFPMAVARLKPGVSLEQAQTEMNHIAGRLEAQYQEFNKNWGVNLVPVREQLAGQIRTPLLVLLGAVGFVLLIACANVANLLLARATARQREMAIRAALGAGRWRVVRQLLTESLLLALTGGGLGLLLAMWGVDTLVALSPPNLIGAHGVGVSLPVLGFTFAVSLLTGVLFGLIPALEASRFDLNESLKESGKSNMASSRSGRARKVFVVAEVALALVLLVGAGLMIKSFMRLQAVEPGFDAENLLTMQLRLTPAKYREPNRRIAFFREAVARIEALPGVRSVGTVSFLPIASLGAATDFTIEGKPAPAAGDAPVTEVRVTDENFFRTMNIPVIAGRTFTEQEATGERRVVVVSQALAREYFPGEDPIGKRITVEMTDPLVPTEIIGVVGDIKHQSLDTDTRPMVYWPHPQLPYSSMTLVIRTAGDPLSLAAAAQREIQQMDKDQPVSDVRTMKAWLGESIARTRFGAMLLGVFATVALALAMVGIYGVMSYAVAQRRHEIGLRMALGARAADIFKLVISQGMILTLVGIGIGLVGAFALTRVMASLLYGVSATDPLTFGLITLLLAGVALLACYVPARRATKVDPMIALRYE
ncbi:MAG: ABC transporter permease [Pyrinomonadaceae bacterium]